MWQQSCVWIAQLHLQEIWNQLYLKFMLLFLAWSNVLYHTDNHCENKKKKEKGGHPYLQMCSELPTFYICLQAGVGIQCPLVYLQVKDLLFFCNFPDFNQRKDLRALIPINEEMAQYNFRRTWKKILLAWTNF